MADIPWPDAFCPAEFEMAIRANVMIATSTYNGQITTSEIPGTRLLARFTMPMNVDSDEIQPEIEAWLWELRGQANRAVFGHMKRRVPRGTARGTLLTSGTAGLGGLSVAVNGTGTLLKGDLLGIGTQAGEHLVMVTANATLPGTVSFSPPLRAPVEVGAPVKWDYPTARWISTSEATYVNYGPGGVNQGVMMEFAQV